MRDVFDNLLISSPNDGGLFLLHRGATYKLDSLDTTGFAAHGNRMLRALQPARLVRFETAEPDGVTSEAEFDDIHDVLLDGKFCYVVKTDTNEIVKLDEQGREHQRWTLPGERDSWHVNCLARWNGRLVFSAFGDLRLHRQYKAFSRESGFVQDLDTGEKLISGLSQPHSLLTAGENLLLADSENFEVREYDAQGQLLRSKKLDGYTRGLLLHGGILFVGLSRSRNVDIGPLANGAVVALDAGSWEEIDRRRLPTDEIYSIQHVADAAITETLAKLASHAAHLLKEQIGEGAREVVHFKSLSETIELQADGLRREVEAMSDLVHEKDIRIQGFEQAIRDDERKIYGLLETVHGKDIHIQHREEIVRAKDLEIQRRDEIIHNKEREIQNRDEVIRCKEAEFRVRDETIRRLENQFVESRANLLARDKVVAEMESRLAVQDGQMQIISERIQRKDEAIRNGDETIRRLESQLAESRADLLARDKVVAEMESRLAVQDGQVQITSEHIQRKDEAIRNGDETIRRLEDQLEKFRIELAARNELVPILESKLVDQQDEIRALKENNHNKAETAERHEKAIQRGENRISTLAEERRRQDEVIERLRAQTDVQTKRIEEMSRNAEAMYSKLCMLTNQLQVSHTQVRDIESSRSWRMTKPMRAIKLALIARKLSKANKVAGFESSRPAQKGPVQRGGQPFAHGLHANVSDAHMAPLLAQDVGPAPSLVTPGFALRGNLLPIVILTTPHCTYVAKEIEDALRRVGIKSRIIYNMPETGYDDVPHFVICPQMFERLPGLYVSFQMEQSVSSRWFTKEYMRQLENSFAIFDYSLVNIAKLQDMGLHAQQMYHVPVGYMQNYATTMDAEPALYDVIFYGDIQNARRREFIAELGNVCKVKVINDLFGAPLHAELARARLVVNIHYYAGALLETTRLWECLSLGKLVVSERSVDMDQHGDLAGLIDFVDVGDIAGMVERVSYWLSNEELRQQRLERNNKALQDTPDQFDAQFYRFLLATDNITFDEFWNVSGQRMKLPGDKVCLNLPEFTRRARSFDRDNRFGFVRFIGLRHSQGWVGCAMSYKLMIMLARQQGLSSVTICEDDVEFLQDFESRWPVIQKYLFATPNDWDVFSGLMADVHADTKIVSAYERDNMQFAVTDRLISMVFNVYNATTFDTIASWDECNRDVNTNTIDRYLERARSIRVLTTLPFLVGHKEELYSTLWGFQNTQYAGLIAASSALLANKVIEYDERELGS